MVEMKLVDAVLLVTTKCGLHQCFVGPTPVET
jgi:hypothetical protein